MRLAGDEVVKASLGYIVSLNETLSEKQKQKSNMGTRKSARARWGGSAFKSNTPEEAETDGPARLRPVWSTL